MRKLVMAGVECTADQASARPRPTLGRRRVSSDGPDPIDVYVGSRLRQRRVSLGMSQTELADRIGLTFQQLQKYETGANRVSASTLWRAADAIDVPVTYFFDGLADGGQIASPEDIDVVVLRITQKVRWIAPAVRQTLSELVDALGGYPDLWAASPRFNSRKPRTRRTIGSLAES